MEVFGLRFHVSCGLAPMPDAVPSARAAARMPTSRAGRLTTIWALAGSAVRDRSRNAGRGDLVGNIAASFSNALKAARRAQVAALLSARQIGLETSSSDSRLSGRH